MDDVEATKPNHMAPVWFYRPTNQPQAVMKRERVSVIPNPPNMKNPTRLALAMVAAGVMLGAVGSASAASVGVSFVGRNAPDAVLAPADAAGVVAQSNWNNVNDDGTTFDGSVPNLLDDAGVFTAVELQYTANDSWSSDGPTATPNDKLMKGIIKANPDPDTNPANGTERMTFVLRGLGTGTYDVIVYATENGAGGKIGIGVGATTNYFEEQTSFDGTFVQATSTDPNNYELGPNYARFNGVAAAGDGSITITATKLIESPQVNDGIGVAGIQIVSATGFPTNSTPVAITTQPTSQTVFEGAAVTFTVGFSGPGKVQWQKDGVDIAGATSTAYTHVAAVSENGAKYTAKVSNNVNSVTSAEATLTVNAAPAVLTQGFAKVERYENIGSTTDAQSLKDAIATGSPVTATYFITSLAAPQTSPDLNNFGSVVTGWLKPDTTGDYLFFLRSDDASQFFLNTTAAASGTNALPDMNADTPIADEQDCCDAFLEPDSGDPSTTATPIHLEADKLYGFVLIYKEGGGGDYAEVAWRLSTDTTPAGQLRLIPGKYLWTLASSAGKTADITTQPASVTVSEGRSATFSLVVTTTPNPGEYGVQWLKNGTAIPGATATTYTTPPATLADSGTKYKAEVLTLLGLTNSAEATLTVVPDTNAPIPVMAGAVANNAGSQDVGIVFDEEVTKASAETIGNYTIAGGTVTAAYYITNSPGVILRVTGLTAGNQYTVAVNNVADPKGNTLSPAVSLPFTANTLTWDVVGGDELGLGFPGGNAVLAVSSNSFDIYSDSIAEWASYDEATMVYEKVSGDFDKKVRLEYQDNSSQWARAGLIVRDVPNFGVNRAAQEGGLAGRYQKVHVNPSGLTRTGPGTQGNNSHEGNRRLATGQATTAPGLANNATPLYPNAWVRLQRVGDQFHLYRSDDGKSWVWMNYTQLPSPDDDPAPLPAELYVGPEFAPENGNVTVVEERIRWLAKFRDYANTWGPAPTVARRDFSIGLNFGSDLNAGDVNSSLQPTDEAGVPGAKQKFWNNMVGAAEASPQAVVADKGGVSTPTTATVTWEANNLWTTLGNGETNNVLKGADFTLMHGYLDTGAATTTQVTVRDVPDELATNTYDVYVYYAGGIAPKGGGYRIVDPDNTTTVIKDYIYARGTAQPPDFYPVPEVTGPTNYGTGNYMVFRGLTAKNIRVEATTVGTIGTGGTARNVGGDPRAPINAVQLVAPGTGGGGGETPTISLIRQGNNLTITFTGKLLRATVVEGPYTDVPGATGGTFTVNIPDAPVQFFRAASQ